MPAIDADAGLVPCALAGMRQMSRWPSPRVSWCLRMTSSPASSPCAPELGCRLTAGKPVISAEHRLELLDDHLVALDLAHGGEGVHAVEARPRDGHHLGRRVELHGARAQRDHRVHERHVLLLERPDVPEHLGLGVVDVEDRVGEVRALALEATQHGRRLAREVDARGGARLGAAGRSTAASRPRRGSSPRRARCPGTWRRGGAGSACACVALVSHASTVFGSPSTRRVSKKRSWTDLHAQLLQAQGERRGVPVHATRRWP